MDLDAARGGSIAGITRALGTIRTHFGPPHHAERKRLLHTAARCALDDPRAVLAYHELLLFALAFPDDREVARLATQELRRLATTVREVYRQGPERVRRRYADSGLAHSESRCRLSAMMSDWLSRRFPRDTEMAWDEDAGSGGLDAMLAAIIEPAETDGLADTALSTQEWLARARGGRRTPSDLRWLLDHFATLTLAPRVREQLFEQLELEIRWRLTHPLASRTSARLPRGARSYHDLPLRRTLDLEALLATRLPPTRPLATESATRLIDAARAALAVRQREIDPVTYADPRDVTCFSMGGGITVVLYGQLPAHRLPLDTYYGFLLAKNRVPIAYGGGWMFGDRCEIGVNVFDTFRGGESALIFGQLLRLYAQHFAVARFTVEPYQFGADNPEAIRSAALWFYYRFGFRPQDSTLAGLAEHEWQRLHNEPGHRTSKQVLRRLTGSFLELGVLPQTVRSHLEPARLAGALTVWIGRRFAGERAAARAWAGAYVRRALGVPDAPNWPDAERRAFDDLALLLAPLADLGSWHAGEKRALISLLRAKGGRQERRFALALARHRRLRTAWTIWLDGHF